ncbi:hypothetical protein QBC39DRAFT_386653 [Podospora conica]|nr:hypothetical protein QBC39DRAFT_386653 [Schizothecium conicum]
MASTTDTGNPKPSTPVNIRHPRQGGAPGSSRSDPSAGNSDSHESYSGPTDHDVGSSEISSSEIGPSGVRHAPTRHLAGAGDRYLATFSGDSSAADDSEDAGAPIGNVSPTPGARSQRWANSVLAHSSSSSSAGSFMPNRGRMNTFGRSGGAPLTSNNNRLRRQATLVPTNESREGVAPSSLTSDLETPKVSTFSEAATSASNEHRPSTFAAVPKHMPGPTSTGTGYRSVTNLPSHPRGGFNPHANDGEFSPGTNFAHSPRGSNHPENFGNSSHGFRSNGRHGTARVTSSYAAVPPPLGFHRQGADRPVASPNRPRTINRPENGSLALKSPGTAGFPGNSPRHVASGERIKSIPVRYDGSSRNMEANSVAARDGNPGEAVEAVDPQAIYPPEACIFVANLCDSKSDEDLEAAVTREFSRFGTVFAKIRRDDRTGLMPFAFCQFTNVREADDALTHGRGIVIHGRPCRTERAKSSRWFVIFRRDGGTMTLTEARVVMQEYGNVSQVVMHEDPKSARGRSSVKVQFENFPPPQREFQLFPKHQRVYQVESLAERRRETREEQDRRFLEEYDLARRSVYVAQLPEGADENELGDHFSAFGRVATVMIVLPPRGQRFAFVEFSNPVFVEIALANHMNHPIRGRYTLRVERKFCKHPSARRVPSMQSIEGHTTIGPAYQPTTPGRSIPWNHSTPEDFSGPGSYHTVSPYYSPSPNHTLGGFGPSPGGRAAPSPARFDGGFSIAGSRTTPARPFNGTTPACAPIRMPTQPPTSSMDSRLMPFAGPLRYTDGPGPAIRTIPDNGIAFHDAATPANTSQGEMMRHGPLAPMNPYSYQYVALDPFTGAPAFMVNAPAMHHPAMNPPTQGNQSTGQEHRDTPFNSMLNRLATGQQAARLADPRVEDVTDAEYDTDEEARKNKGV